MTIENRGTIEPKDVTAIEFECNKCHTKTVRPLNADLNVPGVCGNCQSQFMVEGQEPNDLRILFNLLIRQANAKQPYTLRFEIKDLGKKNE